MNESTKLKIVDVIRVALSARSRNYEPTKSGYSQSVSDSMAVWDGIEAIMASEGMCTESRFGQTGPEKPVSETLSAHEERKARRTLWAKDVRARRGARTSASSAWNLYEETTGARFHTNSQLCKWLGITEDQYEEALNLGWDFCSAANYIDEITEKTT